MSECVAVEQINAAGDESAKMHTRVSPDLTRRAHCSSAFCAVRKYRRRVWLRFVCN